MIRVEVDITILNHENWMDADARFTRKVKVEIPVVYGNDLAWSIATALIERTQQIKEQIISEGFGFVHEAHE